ncbi:hypothetical protein KBD71_00220 [Candidatus Woesebacteria bacterium]|nr:hypothetical protein [Candidatus Woesebacteria bacterium]
MESSGVIRQKTWIGGIICLLASIGFAFYLFSASLSNAFSPIDDHELVLHLRGQERLSISQVTALWQRDLQATGRFRPLYNILRPLELLLWGNHLNLWYLARVILFSLSMFLCWLLLKHAVGMLFASLISSWFFTFAFWADIIGRLGPSESYSLFGLLCWACGLYGLYARSQQTSAWSWLLLSIGSIIAILTKENMLIIVLPTIGITLLNRSKVYSKGLLFLPVISSFLASFFVIRYLVRLSSVVGVDVYGNSLGVSRVSLLLDVFLDKTVLGLLLGSAILLWFSISVPSPSWRRDFSHLCWAWITAVSLLISQSFFYNGQWPTNIRYDFPGMFYKLIIVVSVIFLLKRVVIDRLDNQSARIVTLVLTCFLFLGVIRRSQIWVLRSRVQAYHQLTRSFASGLQAIKATSPSMDIILESTSINDLEIIHAIQVSLRQKYLANAIYLRLHHQNTNEEGALGGQLYTSLLQTQNDGTDVFMPLAKREAVKPCISIFLGQETQTECTPSSIIAVTW